MDPAFQQVLRQARNDCRLPDCSRHGRAEGGRRPEKDGALFISRAWWAKDQELKTPVSIKNATRYKMRLAQSSAAPGRFDPAPPAEIAPGATATCASWAKVESDQKLVYELEAAEARSGDKGRPKPKRWTLTWHSSRGEAARRQPAGERESDGGGWGLDGDDSVSSRSTSRTTRRRVIASRDLLAGSDALRLSSPAGHRGCSRRSRRRRSGGFSATGPQAPAVQQDLTATRIGDVELIAAPNRGDGISPTEGDFGETAGSVRSIPTTPITRPFSRVTQVISIDRAVRNLRYWYVR